MKTIESFIQQLTSEQADLLSKILDCYIPRTLKWSTPKDQELRTDCIFIFGILVAINQSVDAPFSEASEFIGLYRVFLKEFS